MHDIKTATAPIKIRRLFVETCVVHSYNTCSSTSSNFQRKASNRELQKNLLSRIGARLWNEIPCNLRELPNKYLKATIKNKLLSVNYFLQIQEIIIHQTHYEKSDWSRAFNQFTIACEFDMINAISAADIAIIMSSSTSASLLSKKRSNKGYESTPSTLVIVECQLEDLA